MISPIYGATTNDDKPSYAHETYVKNRKGIFKHPRNHPSNLTLISKTSFFSKTLFFIHNLHIQHQSSLYHKNHPNNCPNLNLILPKDAS